MSKNIGKDTHQTLNKQTQQARIACRGIIGYYHQEVKSHRKHRPVENYFSDKEELIKKEKAEAEQEKYRVQRLEEKSTKELLKIREMIELELSKVKICLYCKKKFGSYEALQKHEKESALHKSKIMQIKKIKQFNEISTKE